MSTCAAACSSLRFVDSIIFIVIGQQSSFCEGACSLGCSDSYCRTYSIENAYQGLLVAAEEFCAVVLCDGRRCLFCAQCEV